MHPIEAALQNDPTVSAGTGPSGTGSGRRPARAAAARGKAGADEPATGERALEICEGIIDIVAALFDIPGRELRRPGRNSVGISRVRQIAMYVAHVSIGLNMRHVGEGFGRDRTTVVHACHLIEDMRDEPEFDNVVAVSERVVLAAFGRGGERLP